ncbi:MAG: AMP-binding protein [Alphaproteobacteria bacterium]|nr:AMP-binding protein [Alphaproteobacteria bacterium]
MEQVLLSSVDSDSYFSDGMKQMSSSDIEFLSALELESLWQTEEQSRSGHFPVAKAVEGQTPLEGMDLSLFLLRVSDSELLQKDGMKGSILFNSKLFDQSTVVMMFECFKNLLEMAVENPHKVVWDLPMLTQAEQKKQLMDWNKTSAPFPKPGWLAHEFFLDQAEANPNAIALIEYGGLKRNISYAELQSMAEKVARQMRVLGVEVDSTVGLLMTNDSAEAIASIYGT